MGVVIFKFVVFFQHFLYLHFEIKVKRWLVIFKFVVVFQHFLYLHFEIKLIFFEVILYLYRDIFLDLYA